MSVPAKPSVASASATPEPSTAAPGAVTNRGGNLYRWFAMVTVGGSTAGALIAAWQWWQGQVVLLDYGLLAVFYFATALGIEAGFHRFFSHAAFSCGPRMTYLLGALGSMAAEGPVLFWAATHRQHHVFTDQVDDPHSPQIHDGSRWGRIKSFCYAHVGWLFASRQSSWARFAPDLLRRREIMTINQHYLLWVVLGLALPTVIAGGIGGNLNAAWHGFIWGGLLRIFLLHHVTWGVNSLAHCYGRRPYATRDNSRNLAWLAIPSVGGAWHNNHHALPASARNDHQSKWQIDLSGGFIELLGRLRLADNIKRPHQLSGKFAATTAKPTVPVNTSAEASQQPVPIHQTQPTRGRSPQ